MRIFAAGLSGFVLIAADVGHALAHSISARAAGAPMDKIDLTSGMPRTIYYDQAVPPRTHILRALGGPLYSALGLVLSLVARSLLPRNSAAREVAGWSSIGHCLIFAGSLAPLPIVDGGSILKWTLVESGKAPQEADQARREGRDCCWSRRRGCWCSPLPPVVAGCQQLACWLQVSLRLLQPGARFADYMKPFV